MRKYTIKLPGYPRPFPYIADISPEEVEEAIFQRFRIFPEWARWWSDLGNRITMINFVFTLEEMR